MATTLTDRQAQIFKAIIEEYTTTAEPVGSVTLEKKYDLGISPATIRNEMAALTSAGFLNQPHTSAGRSPTPLALKYYIRELVKEEEMSVAEEVAVKEKVWDYRQDYHRFFQELTRALADKTKTLAITCTSTGHLFHSGYSHILENPEFYDIDTTREVLSLLDEFPRLNDLFKKAVGDEPVHVLVGDDVDLKFFEPLSMVFADFIVPDKFSGSVGILGPSRLNYSNIIPVIRYFGDLVNEISKNW